MCWSVWHARRTGPARTTMNLARQNDPQVLASFLNLMLEEFGDVIDAVEVWNEPNLLREWTGRPISGSDYMRYFRVARDAINNYSYRMQFDDEQATPFSYPCAHCRPCANRQ